MAKTIKIAEGFKVTVDGYVKEFRHDGKKTVGEYWNDGMDFLNIPKDEKLRDELFCVFFCQGFLNLSDAYSKRDADGRVIEGHTVKINVIPVGE